MNQRKKQLTAIITLLAFATLVVLGTYYYVSHSDTSNPFVSWIFQYHFEFMLLIGLGGLAVGAFSFYLFGAQVTAQKEITRKNTKVLLAFLDFDEKKIIEKLLEENGKSRQYELAYAAGLNKVRAHRAIKKLANKGVIEIQKAGKINIIKLKNEIHDGLKE